MLSDVGTISMYVLPIVRDTICSAILIMTCCFCGLGRPLRVKHRANVDLRAFDLGWRRLTETCRVSLLFMVFFLGIYVSFWHYAVITCRWCTSVWYSPFVTVNTATYSTLESWKAPVSPPPPPLDRAGGPKWFPLDFLLYIWFLTPDSDGSDPHPDGKRDSFYVDTPCNK